MAQWKNISVGLVVLVIVLAGVSAFSLARAPEEKTLTRTIERTQERTVTATAAAAPTTVTATVTQARTVTATITAAPAPKALTTVKVSTPSAKSPSWLAFYVADELGYFAREGIKVENPILPGDSTVQALLSGEVDFALTSDPLGVAVLRGAEIKMLTYSMKASSQAMVSKPEIKTIAQLNGKKIASEIPGSGTYITVEAFINKYNIKADQIPFDTTPARVAALEAGRVDAVYVQAAAAIQLAEKGYNILATEDQFRSIPFAFIAALEKTIKEKPQLVLGFTKAFMNGVSYTKSFSEGTSEVIVKRIGLTPAQAKKYYDGFVDLYTNDFKAEEVQKFLDVLADSRKLTRRPYSQVFDVTFYAKIMKEGL